MKRLILSSLFSLFYFVPSSAAAPITFELEAMVNFIDPNLGVSTPFSIGQSVDISYTFDSTASDVDPNPIFGTYENITAFSADYGSGAYVVSATDGRITVGNDEPGFGDTYRAFSTTSVEDLSGPSVNGNSLTGASVFFRDIDGLDAFSNTDLPLIAPMLSNFDIVDFSLFYGNFVVSAQVKDISVSNNEVPEPGTLALLSLGLLAAAFRRKLN